MNNNGNQEGIHACCKRGAENGDISNMHVISMVCANPELTNDCLHATKEVPD